MTNNLNGTNQSKDEIDSELLDICRDYADSISIFDAHDRIWKVLKKYGYQGKKGKTGAEAEKLKTIWLDRPKIKERVKKLADKFKDFGVQEK